MYNLDGIDTDGIMAAKSYDGWEHSSLSHHMSVRFSDGSPVPEIIVNDRLSDGSAAYDQMYGYGGLNDRGVIKKGNIANLVTVDHLFNVKSVYLNGKKVR